MRFKRFRVEGFGIELLSEPFADLGMALVLFVADRLQHFSIAPGDADVFRRAAPSRLDQPRVKGAGFGVDEALDFDRVLPAVAEVVEITRVTG